MDDSLKKSFEELESNETIDELGKNISKLFLYVIESQLDIKKSLSNTQDGMVHHILKSIDDVKKEVENLSIRLDRFTESSVKSSNVQNKRKNNGDDNIKTRGPKRNILGYIKDQWFEEDWKFFDTIIEDPEKIIGLILEENKEEIMKKTEGLARKRYEASVIWQTIKDVKGVRTRTQNKYKEHKENIKKKEGLEISINEENINEEKINEN